MARISLEEFNTRVTKVAALLREKKVASVDQLAVELGMGQRAAGRWLERQCMTRSDVPWSFEEEGEIRYIEDRDKLRSLISEAEQNAAKVDALLDWLNQTRSFDERQDIADALWFDYFSKITSEPRRTLLIWLVERIKERAKDSLPTLWESILRLSSDEIDGATLMHLILWAAGRKSQDLMICLREDFEERFESNELPDVSVEFDSGFTLPATQLPE
jgi:alkylated DNA nucleotide flippase Atl1